MSKRKGIKTASIFFGMLLCMVCMQAAFALPAEPEGKAGTGNFTVHSINPSSYSISLMAGTNQTFTVSFTNEGNSTLQVAPKVVTLPYMTNKLNESWVSISPETVDVAPGSTQEFTIDVRAPKDAEGGYYQAAIAFADDIELYTAGNNYPQYVNILDLGVNVQATPKLELQTTYISDSLEAGKAYEYTIKMKNVADKDITIDPKVMKNMYGGIQAFSEDLIEITAPSTMKPDEITNMTIRVPVPENATGSFNGNIDMNVDGKSNDGTSPQLNLGFSIWKQPAVPYVKTFTTTTRDPVTIEVSTDTYDNNPWIRTPKKEEPSFKLSLKYNSSPVNMTLVKTSQSGSVSLGGLYYPLWIKDDSLIYQNNGIHYAETYTVPGAVGNWELSVLPKNAEVFGYSITIENPKSKEGAQTKVENNGKLN
jgi:hypothetical protein